MSTELGMTGALLAPERSEGERSEPQRSVGASSAAAAPPGGVPPPALPDPEVSAGAVRRRFTAEYKRRILREAEACGRGELGALLRREGLYSSLLASWRTERTRGEVAALTPKPRGPKKNSSGPLVRENERLRREIKQLQNRLKRVETLLEIQKKISDILGIPLNPPPSDEPE